MSDYLHRAVAVAAWVVFWLAGEAGAFQFPEATPQKFELKGVVKAIQPGFIQVIGSNGEVWVVKVDPKLKNIKLTGNAEPSWLRPGMFVQFDNRFDNRGQPVTSVGELQVFTPTEKTQFGAVPLAERSTEVVIPDPPQTVDLRVTGRLVGYKDDKITVMAGSTPVTVPLAAILTITVEVADYSLAQSGDTISVTGKYVVKGQGVADKIEIKGGAIFTGPKPKK